MTYLDALTEARAINRMDQRTPAYIKRWNDLEDTLLGKIHVEEVEAIRAAAREERGDIMAAQLLLTMLGE